LFYHDCYFSLISLFVQNTLDNNFLNIIRDAITKISHFMIYIGLISVLISSVTWKWERRKNEITNQYEFVEREQETPQMEFNRRRLFAIGVFTSVYGTAMQAALSFMQ